MWRQRLDGWDPPFVAWLRHQARDEFWRHGSVCENYADIECAVFAVGGWAAFHGDDELADLKRPAPATEQGRAHHFDLRRVATGLNRPTWVGAAPGDCITILYDAFGDRLGFDLP